MTGPIRTRLQPIEEAVAPTTAGDTLQWNGSAYVWAPAGGGGGAPTTATYVTLSNDATLTNERVLTAGSGITITDNGAGNTVVISSSGGAGANVGTATIDFGAFPGSSHATVVVTGQTGIVAGSIVQAWLRPVATADHSADEHMLETISVHAADIVAGTGFTVHALNVGTINEPAEDARAKDNLSQFRAGGPGQQSLVGDRGGRGTRLYGQWTIAWSWV